MKWYYKSFCTYLAQGIIGPNSKKDSARRRPKKTSSWNKARGVAIIWVAFVLFAIVLVVGLGLDRARLYIDASQLQNAADAAALAGGQYVKVGYLAAIDPDPNNDYEYPTIVFRVAQEFAKQHKACHATVNLDVPDLSGFDETVDVIIGHYRTQARPSTGELQLWARLDFPQYSEAKRIFLELQKLQVFTPYDPDDSEARTPNAVAVIAQQTADSAVNDPMPLIFGRIVSVDYAGVERLAISISQGSTGAGLIVLEEYPNLYPQYPNHGTGLQVQAATVNVNNGDIQVNSWSNNSPWYAFRGQGSFELNCEEMNVCGGVYPTIDDPFWQTVEYNVNANTGIPLDDPLEHIPDLNPLPDIPQTDPITGDDTSGWTDDIIDSTVIATYAQETFTDANGEDWKVLTLAPGYYPGGIRMTSASSGGYWLKLKLQPGIYALGGDDGPANNPGTGLFINSGTFEAEGVMLYVTQSLTGVYGAVDVRGGTQTHVKIYEAYNPEDPDNDHYPGYEGTDYEYIAIFQDRNNTNEAFINGSTEIDLKGSLYFKNANFHCGGDGLQAGTQLVAGTVEVDAGSVINLNYDGRFYNAGFRSLLVE